MDTLLSIIAFLITVGLLIRFAERIRQFISIPEDNKVESITITGNLPAVQLDEIAGKPFVLHSIAMYQTGSKQIWVMQLALSDEPVIAWTDNANIGWKLFQYKKSAQLMFLANEIINMEAK